MTGHQKAVLWMGLILILLNLIHSAYWRTIKGTLFKKTTGSLVGGALPGLATPFLPGNVSAPPTPGLNLTTPGATIVNA